MFFMPKSKAGRASRVTVVFDDSSGGDAVGSLHLLPECTALKVLEINHVDLSTPRAIQTLNRYMPRTLVRLGVRLNGIHEIPSVVFEQQQLYVLHMMQNPLTSVPGAIGRLTNLTRLSLEHTLITTLPPEIGNLSQLTQLHLHHTPLETLPREMSQLTRLEALDMDHTNISEIPRWIGNLTSLKDLRFAHTRIDRLPREMCKLASLDLLCAYGCRFRHLPIVVGSFADPKFVASVDILGWKAPPGRDSLQRAWSEYTEVLNILVECGIAKDVALLICSYVWCI